MNRHNALLALGRALRARDYRFVTVTPETHRRVLARDPRPARRESVLRDVFGWSRAFDASLIDEELLMLMRGASVLAPAPGEDATRGGAFVSRVRFSSLGDRLLVHSAYPTTDADAVFFGPDTYRFCAAIERLTGEWSRVFDIGCGTGAGGLIAASRAREVVLGDVNEQALAFARVNAELASVSAETVISDVLASARGSFDLVLANPPYMLDTPGRQYRDGGGNYGEGLALRILEEAIARLAPGGRLLLYTGAPFVDGIDVFFEAARERLARASVTSSYEELDPDVFGEELDSPDYAAVERIAAVVLTVTASSR